MPVSSPTQHGEGHDLQQGHGSSPMATESRGHGEHCHHAHHSHTAGPHGTTASSLGTSSPKAGVAEYTCPMHPEVRQAGPGQCPICGMALEPVLVTLEQEESP